MVENTTYSGMQMENRTVKTVLGMGGRGTKENEGGGEFTHDIL
jgi:hypothetical protein